MAELHLNEYARAATEMIERFKAEMEQKARKLDETSTLIKNLEGNKTRTDDDQKKLDEATRLRDALRKGALEYSRTLDSRLRSLKLRKDTDQNAFTEMQRSLGSKLESVGLRFSDHLILKLKPIKLNGVMFEFKGRF